MRVCRLKVKTLFKCGVLVTVIIAFIQIFVYWKKSHTIDEEILTYQKSEKIRSDHLGGAEPVRPPDTGSNLAAQQRVKGAAQHKKKNQKRPPAQFNDLVVEQKLGMHQDGNVVARQKEQLAAHPRTEGSIREQEDRPNRAMQQKREKTAKEANVAKPEVQKHQMEPKTQDEQPYVPDRAGDMSRMERKTQDEQPYVPDRAGDMSRMERKTQDEQPYVPDEKQPTHKKLKCPVDPPRRQQMAIKLLTSQANGAPLRYCPVRKVGSTFWQRIFFILNPNTDKTYTDPFEVPASFASAYAKLENAMPSEISNGFSFMFVRNPYARIFSLYVDKLVSPNPTYWKLLGEKAVRYFRDDNKMSLTMSGQDVTFTELIRYATYLEENSNNADSHVQSVFKTCDPCHFNFSFIGKGESFQDDAFAVLKLIGLAHIAETWKDDFSELSLHETIKDTVRGPFSWKYLIDNTITWEAAIKRIWLVLQLRGIISVDIDINFTINPVARMTEESLVALVVDANRKSDKEKLQLQKQRAMRDAFESVPAQHIINFRSVFENDFSVFGYNDSLEYLLGEGGNDNDDGSLLFNFDNLFEF